MDSTNFHPVARAWYEYTDEDIHTLNKVRNHNQGYDYLSLLDDYGRPQATSILMQQNTNNFVQNSLGGIVLEAPAMSITGQERQNRVISKYLSSQVANILRLENQTQNTPTRIYPAKIIFPYNPSQGHWIAGEIIINKTNGIYDIKLSQYNPMADYSQPISQSFCDLFAQVFRAGMANRRIQANVRINHNFLPARIGRRTNSVEKIRIQQGGVACGVYTAYALDRLKTGSAENMWDGFPYDGSSAMQQRNHDIKIVRNAYNQYIIGDAEYLRFVGGSEAVAVRNSVAQDFLQRAKKRFTVPTVPPKTAQKVSSQKTDPKKASSSKPDPNILIQDLEDSIQQNLQDQNFLSTLLRSIIKSPSSNEVVDTIKASMLIMEGAVIDETMLDRAAQNKELHNILVNEYYLQILQTASFQDFDKFIKKYEDTLSFDYSSIKDGSNIFHNFAQNKHRPQQSFSNFFESFKKTKFYNETIFARLVNSINCAGYCPLTIAILHENVAAVKGLIDIGADLNQDRLGRSIAEIAQEMASIKKTRDSQDIAEFINKKIAQQIAHDQSSVAGSSFVIDSADTVFEKITTLPQNFSQYEYYNASDPNLLVQARQIADDHKIKRKRLTIDRSDFVTQKSGEYILLTANEFSLHQKIGSNGRKRTSLGGDYRDIFLPSGLNSAEKSFQPYYANFGGLCFVEQPGGAKIFDNAELFMANFRNCVFENVDFSRMNPVIFATMQFHKCVFSKCIFPQGIDIDSRNNIKPDTGISQIADQIRDEVRDARQESDEEQKNNKIEALYHKLIEDIVPQTDTDSNITRKNNGIKISKERLDKGNSPDPQGVRKPIAHQCIVDQCTMFLPSNGNVH